MWSSESVKHHLFGEQKIFINISIITTIKISTFLKLKLLTVCLENLSFRQLQIILEQSVNAVSLTFSRFISVFCFFF